jgi:phosphatidate cytidylyltransferase
MPGVSGATVATRLDRFDPALRRRVATGGTLGVIAVADVVLGGWFFAAFLIMAAILMADEWADLAKLEDSNAEQLVRVAAGASSVVAIVLTMEGELELGLGVLGLAAVAAAGSAALLPAVPVHRAAFGVVYIGLPCVCLVWLRNVEQHGFQAVLWLLVVVWATDIFAYFVGRGVGGPKLAPRISPSKTWAGLAGAVGGAVAVGASVPLPGHSRWAAAVLAGVLAVVAQAGDLFESHLKRRAGVKDSGRLLPGHGGLLDRVDGLLVATPAFVLVFIAHGGAE